MQSVISCNFFFHCTYNNKQVSGKHKLSPITLQLPRVVLCCSHVRHLPVVVCWGQTPRHQQQWLTSSFVCHLQICVTQHKRGHGARGSCSGSTFAMPASKKHQTPSAVCTVVFPYVIHTDIIKALQRTTKNAGAHTEKLVFFDDWAFSAGRAHVRQLGLCLCESWPETHACFFLFFFLPKDLWECWGLKQPLIKV